MPQRLMGTDLVVLLAPILKQSVCLQQILRDLPQDFLLHGAVKALDLPLVLISQGILLSSFDSFRCLYFT